MDKNKIFSITEIIFFSLVLGPTLSALITYYLYLMFPGHSPFLYFSALYIFFVIVFLRSRSVISDFWAETKKKIFSSKINYYIVLFSFIIGILAWQLVVLQVPVLRHDTYEYGTFAKIIYRDKAIVYKSTNYDPQTGFFFVGKHGITFIMYGVINDMWSDISMSHNDFFFRSVTGWYWFIIIFLLFYYLAKKNPIFSAVAAISLAAVPAFSAGFIYYHLDTYRIALLLCSLILLLYAIEKKDQTPVVLFGVFMGLMVNAHSLNVFFAGVLGILYFIFARSNLKHRIINCILIVVFMMLFGGIHYLLDSIYGTGWFSWIISTI